jgi:hypothetical protein
MPKVWLKTKKPPNLQTVNPKMMYKGLLESYNPFPQVCKISSIPSTNCNQNTMPKSRKSLIGSLLFLGVKVKDGNIGGNSVGNIFVANSRNVISGNVNENVIENVIGNVFGNIIGNIPRNIIGNIEIGPSNITMH